jgi:thioredoxin 1
MSIGTSNIQVQNKPDFEKLLQSKDTIIALVYASWCPFCIRFLPVFQKLAGDDRRFIMFEDNQEIMADQYDINVVPSVIFFKNGVIVNRLDGFLGVGISQQQLADFIKICKLL